MAYSLWEILRFTSAELRQRQQTMTFEEREAERLEAWRKAELRTKQLETPEVNASDGEE